VSVRDFYGPVHRGFRKSRQLECLVSYRPGGQRRCCNADECVYEDSSIVVVVIEHRSVRRVTRVRVIGPVHMDRTASMMVGRVVVWVGVRQRSAHRGTLDGHRQRQSKRLSDHGHIVGERGHLVKSSTGGYWGTGGFVPVSIGGAQQPA
jgi:hypothetical protein